MTEHTLINMQQRVNQPIASATGLPNERYVAPQSYIEDRDLVAGTGWSCIAFIEDLPENNYVLPIDFMGVPLVVTRDNEGTLRVFHNVCSHRGLHLADKPCKTNGMLRCPYHSWTYKMNGELRGTPHLGGYGIHDHPDFDKASSGLREVRSAIWLGCVFVNLSGQGDAFETCISPLTRQIVELCDVEELNQFVSASHGCRTTMTVQSNWKLPVENYLESYHLPTVHPELNRVSPLDVHFDLERFANGGGQASSNYSRTEHNGTHLPALSSWDSKRENLAIYPVLYPNTFIGLHIDHLFIMYLQPVSNTETIEHVRLSYVGNASLLEEYQSHRESLLTAWTEVFKEDIFAVERMQQGRLSPGYEGGVFSPAMDEPTLHFHQWVANQLVKHSPNV